MEVERLSQLVDDVSTLEMIEMINEEDKKVAEAVGKAKLNIAKAVDVIANRLEQQFYVLL